MKRGFQNLFNNKNILAIIPARSGSKGIKNKNLKLFCGKPLISHTIIQACNSKYIDNILVTSDCNKILDLAKEFNNITIIKRPNFLANDTSTNIEVILHALNYANCDIFVLLQPTSPLRESKDIDNAIDLLNDNENKTIISAYEIKNHQYSFHINKNQVIREIKNEITKKTNRQFYEKAYTVNGSIYISYADCFKKDKIFIRKGVKSYIMPLSRSIDIDDKDDWEIAEMLYNNR